ncbi:alginate O-acetyltransferase AlgX-related protein [Conexibacter woesei]|uniref:alginate O-acetyltransferase AlgX-related protein n=1 Tax=Conexibacter woesei TaxID=191495 RepID=UPI0003F5BA21|nr:hypothetical protein [Conexibacter woesei]
MPARKLLPIAWLVALLVAPAAIWAGGGRQALLDNRPKTAFPAKNIKSLRHDATYRQFDAAFFERLPVRARALSIHGKIAVDLFHDSSAPDVVLGHHGYRYFTPGTRTCGDSPPAHDPADAAQILALTLVAAGKRALVLEPADKLFIHPQDVPAGADGLERLACARALQAQVEQRLLATKGGGSIDEALRTLEAGGTPTYLKTDTHWNGTGRLIYIRRVLDALRPGLSGQMGVGLGPQYDRQGDLNSMLGLISTTERDRLVVARRPASPPFAPGEALVVGDSQTERSFTDPLPGNAPPLAQTALKGVTFCSIPHVIDMTCDQAILRARSMVVESVGRNLIDFDTMCGRPVGLLAARLTGPRGSYRSADDRPRPDAEQVRIGEAGTDTVTLRAPGGDAAPYPRLIRLPIVRNPKGGGVAMTQQPRTGLAAPCQGAAGGSMVLAVPAHRKLSDLPIVLQATAGVVLGAPRTIALDGSPAPRAATREHR